VRTLPPEIEGLVEAAGGVPDPQASDLQHRRYHHQDLLDLHDDELDAERIMVGIAKAALLRNRCLRCDREVTWFTDRLAAVVAEITRRQRRPRQ
jgi:hypothetical protein